ncbi:MAG TPA: NAD(P)/FAD-dependent oxidoreductase [Ilumatobacter sp.]|nr:NAD(P)/FAD-dependent oxidoreductase [Ilumatobacter sp.]
MANESGRTNRSHDVVIVGAGISGIYMLHRARQFGLDAIALEAGSGVGGTWYWNRYPGARCDIQSLEYSYSFDEQLQQEWHWPEKYSSQADILDYLNHVCDRFGLRSGIQLDTRVESATYDEERGRWLVATDRGAIDAQFVVMATGSLSSANTPDIPGLDRFAGHLLHTARWPHEPVDFSDQRVAVVGTGSSGVQVAPEIARQAARLYVLQRTASHSLPSNNGPLDPELEASIKAEYAAFREANRRMPAATGAGHLHAIHDESALEVGPDERQRAFEESWTKGGFTFTQTYRDLVVDRAANALASEFIREKIHSIVHDPTVAELLTPKLLIGCKRMCIDSGYYEMFNRPNVELVDVSETPITALTEHHLHVGNRAIEVDAIVFATGFDAMTGSLLRIDIRGRRGVTLREAWDDGPGTYLGLTVAGFPNLFTITGPGSPSALTNVIMSAEHHVEWVTECIDHMRRHGHRTVEATANAQRAWGEHVESVAATSLRTDPTCNSWYLGSNISGKKRQFMLLLGFPAYVERCAEIAASGYDGFQFDTSPAGIGGVAT